VNEDKVFLENHFSDLKSENLENSEFEKRTAEALERYEKGQFTEMSAKKFLKTLGKW